MRTAIAADRDAHREGRAASAEWAGGPRPGVTATSATAGSVTAKRRRFGGVSRLLAVALFCLAGAGGCLGHLMGWSDTEVEQLRQIVAELEAKNAELVEEVLRLRKASAGGPVPGRASARPEQ